MGWRYPIPIPQWIIVWLQAFLKRINITYIYIYILLFDCYSMLQLNWNTPNQWVSSLMAPINEPWAAGHRRVRSRWRSRRVKRLASVGSDPWETRGRRTWKGWKPCQKGPQKFFAWPETSGGLGPSWSFFWRFGMVPPRIWSTRFLLALAPCLRFFQVERVEADAFRCSMSINPFWSWCSKWVCFRETSQIGKNCSIDETPLIGGCSCSKHTQSWKGSLPFQFDT